jgi:hypothetical protein
MSKKKDVVHELQQEFFMSRNALTKLEHDKDGYKEMIETMKAVTSVLAEQREALLEKKENK